jgi:tRNA/tmRNA/rRNA uracil-C5-methylase (TrmA/RlmC/RlmD family)
MTGRADPGGSNNTSKHTWWTPGPPDAARCASIGDDEAVKVESGETLRPGAVIELRILDVAHGGHCIGRHDGQVVFVRHSLPGELVRARIQSTGGGGKFLRADVIEVLEPAAGRVSPPCAFAGSCGGCDFQHADIETQHRLKSTVASSALSRALGREITVAVRRVPGDNAGLGWRTRVRLAVDDHGTAGFRGHRSHAVIAVTDCPIAHPDLRIADVLREKWEGASEVIVETDALGDRSVSPVPGPWPPVSRRRAAGRDWQVPSAGFWQVHPGAADALVDAVRLAVDPKPGEHIVDLYAGVGLFGGSLAADVGPTGRVDLVESGRAAVRAAGHNLADQAQVRVHFGDVASWLGQHRVKRADILILDPPRSGAGTSVISRCARLAPRVICYVACDPAALARDAKSLAELGWELTDVHGFDQFPMTHHVECVAVFRRQSCEDGSSS